MGLKKVTPKNSFYGEVQRGASLCIPVKMITPEEDPIDLTGYKVAFTVKPQKTDFDTEDKRAYVSKDFEPQNAVNGSFFVELSSEDLNFEPGSFYFDIELYQDEGAVCRLATLTFDLVGGPTNRTVNSGLGQLSSGDQITVVSLLEGRPIVIVAPITGDATITAQITSLYETMLSLQQSYEDACDTISGYEDSLQALTERVEQLESSAV